MIEPPIIQNEIYQSGIFVPRNSWQQKRIASGQVMKLEDSRYDQQKDVFISRVDNALIEKFFELYISHVNLGNASKEREVLNSAVLPLLKDDIIRFLNGKGFFPAPPINYAIQTNKAHRILLEKETVNEKRKRNRSNLSEMSSTAKRGGHGFAGLHVDNWSTPRRSAKERNRAGVRFGLNLGVEFREVAFLDFPVHEMFERLRSVLGDAAKTLMEMDFATPAADAFLYHFPDYRVQKITLPPGFCYVLPVQNLIHDGFPFRKQKTDINLMVSADHWKTSCAL